MGIQESYISCVPTHDVWCVDILVASWPAILLMETDAVTGKDAQDMHSEAQAADALRKLKAENRNLAKRKELILKAEAARNQ